MISAAQLRVGNIYSRKHGKGHTPTMITEEIMGKIFSDSKEYALQDFDPIPLVKFIKSIPGIRKATIRPTHEGFGNDKEYDIEWIDPNGFSIFVHSEFKFRIGFKQGLCYIIEDQLGSDEESSMEPIGQGFQYFHELQLAVLFYTGKEINLF